jgi:hypothetical protein
MFIPADWNFGPTKTPAYYKQHNRKRVEKVCGLSKP